MPAVTMPDVLPEKISIHATAARFRRLRRMSKSACHGNALYLLADGYVVPMWDVEQGMQDLYEVMKTRGQQALDKQRELFSAEEARWRTIEEELRTQLRDVQGGYRSGDHRAEYKGKGQQKKNQMILNNVQGLSAACKTKQAVGRLFKDVITRSDCKLGWGHGALKEWKILCALMPQNACHALYSAPIA